jgi:hypothetical protein
LLGRIIQGLGATCALGHVIPCEAEEGEVSKHEAGRLIVHVTRPLDAETPVQEFASRRIPISLSGAISARLRKNDFPMRTGD